MKRFEIMTIISAVLLLAGLSAATGAIAAEPAMTIPATSAGIWTAVDQKSAELRKLVTNGSLADVHRVAFSIRDLVAALPAKSTNLPAEKQAAVKTDVKFVATIAGRLDESGDGNRKRQR